MSKSIENIKSFLWVIVTPLERIIDKPILFFGLTTFLINRSWEATFFLLFTWLGAVLWLMFVVRQKNVKTYKEFLNAYILTYSHCTFSKYSFADFFKNEELWVFQLNRVSQQSILEIADANNYIFVVKRKKEDSGKIFPATYTTFPIASNSSYIMVTEDPKDMNSFQRFCLYHEIGHISGVQSEIQDRVLLNQTQGFILLVVGSIVTQGNPLAVFSLAIFYWLWNFIGENIAINEEVDYEIVADTYALFMTAHDSVFDNTSRLFRDYMKNVKHDNPDFLQRRLYAFDRCRSFIEQAGSSLFLEAFGFPNVLSKGISKLFNINPNTPEFNQSVGYLSLTGIQWDPSTRSYMLTGFLISISGIFANSLSIWNLAVVSIPLVVLPFVCLFRTLYSEEQLKFQVDEELCKIVVVENVASDSMEN